MRLLILLCVALVLAAPGAQALESAPVTTPRTTATLVSDADSLQSGQPVRIALRLRMAPGWHTYWRNPGDAGAPPELTFTLPDGVTAGPIEWAAPRRMPEGPLMTYGYSGEVLLPVRLSPSATAVASNAAMPIVVEATWLICKDICVPEDGRFVLELPVGPARSSPEAALFAAHDRAVPRAAPWTARIAADGTLAIQGAELGSATVREAWFIPETADAIQNDAAQALAVHEGGFSLTLRLGRGLTVGETLDGIVSIRARSGQQSDFVVRATPGTVDNAAMPLLQILGLAFLGGLILNLMPCVFPVLAMKAMALARGASTGQVRAHALSYTAGVLVMFASLGGALLAARAAGTAAGWGFQFQSPAFVAVMAWLLFAVGLNLSGVFRMGGALAGAGSTLADRGGHVGSFFTGLLAVLVATPCTAPFMGAAIAAGLAAPPAVTISVFLAMGLGLAAPYGVLAVAPGLGRLAPRPGAWMDLLKQLLAFPMYGAAVWLLWVVSQSGGPDGVLITATGLLLLAFACWALGQAQARHAGVGRRLALGATALSLVALLALLAGIASAPEAPAGSARADAWSAERLAALRREGRPVFVNMTAAWCVTCLVNERVALRTAATTAAFAHKGITYLKGDWTRQDPAITAYLRQFNRDGVPLYVYYPGGEQPPVVLPQILTEGIVLSALERE
jgi:thiol:disulfide interchange protein DsbD